MESSARLIEIGEFARACLRNEQQGRVLASTSKSLWLMTEAGQLFWLADAQAPMHRRCGRLDGSVPRVAPRTHYEVRGDTLMIGSDNHIGVGGPTGWQAPAARRAARAEAILASVYGLLCDIEMVEGRGFAGLLPSILLALEDKLPEAEVSDIVLRRAEPLVRGLVRAAIHDHRQKMSEMADGLAGLGPGLTPSGDDFLGGLLFAMRTWEATFVAARKRSTVIATEQFARRTHIISFTFMADMAKGHAIAPLHGLVNGIISGDTLNHFHSHVTDLIRIGYSTGWDLLTGLLTGLLIGIRAEEG